MARAPRLLIVIGLTILLGVVLNISICAQGIEDGIISAWNMNETSGVRYDVYGLHDLTDNNTVRAAEGVLGNAAVFADANNEYLSYPDTADTLTFDQEFTIITWLWISATQPGQYERIVSKWGSGSGEYILYLNNRVLKLDASPGGVPNNVSASELTTETWHFLAAWMDSSNLYLQIDDGDVISATHTGGSLPNTPNIFRISDYAYGLNGKIDLTRVWSRTLTPLERHTLYQNEYANISPSGGGVTTTTTFLPLILNNWPPWNYPDDPEEEDIVIIGPPGEDNLWRDWVETIDGIIDPIYERIQEIWAGIADLNDQGCGIEETYAAGNSLLMRSYSMLTPEGTVSTAGIVIFDPEATFQETSYNLGLALGEPIGLMRGFIKANIAPVSYIMLTLNFLVAAVVWIVFVEAFALSVWLIRSLIDIIYKAWMALPFT